MMLLLSLLLFSEPGTGGVRAGIWSWSTAKLLHSDLGAAYASAGHGRGTTSHHGIVHLQTAAGERRQGRQSKRSVRLIDGYDQQLAPMLTSSCDVITEELRALGRPIVHTSA